VSWEGVTLDAVGGPLAGQLSIDGGLAALREPRAVLSLPHTRVQVAGQDLEILPTSIRLERGRVTASDLTLRTGRGDLVVTGAADLVARTLDMHGRGRVELGTLSSLLGAAALGGVADVDVGVSGPIDAPHARGSVRVREGSVRARLLPQSVTGLEGALELDGTHASVNATGRMGGGTVELGGEAEVSGTTVHDVQLVFTGKGVGLSYPPGLRSRLDADLVLLGRAGALTLDGDVGVDRGVYELDVAVEEALRAPVAAVTESEALRGVGLDVRVRLPRPVLVRSTLGQIEATGQLTARGDLQEPLPFGRLDVRPGGKLYLQGREFTVRDGAMTYSGTWDPEVSLRAEAAIPSTGYESREYKVSVSAGGTLEKPTLSFSSEPSLSQQEIVALVATGRIEGRLADTSAWLIGGQAGALLAGRLTRNVAQTFGLDEITIRPDLIARETDPSARFTFGKNLGRRAGLIYSVGLGGPETRFVQLEGRPGRDVTVKVQRTDSGTYGAGLGQRFHWGGPARDEGSVEAPVKLRELRFEGEAMDEELRRSVPLHPGSRVTEWKVQDEAERLRDRLRSRGHLDAEVAARLVDDAAILTVRPGPVYTWRVEGLEDPPDLTPVVRGALFAEEALDRGRERLLGRLHEQGHLRAVVAGSTQGEGDQRTLVFSAEPGPRFESVTLSFPGTHALSEGELREAAGGAARLLDGPEQAVSAIREAYLRRHYLRAAVHPPRVEEAAARLQIAVPVEEGPPARLAAVRFEGASLAEDVLLATAGLAAGEPFSDAGVEPAVSRVRELYYSRGYPAVRVRPQLVEKGTDLALVLHVDEGEPVRVDEIVLDGNTRTRDSLVRRALGLKPGDPLDPRGLARAEQRMLNLGVFSRAAIVPRTGTPSTLDVQLEEAPNLNAADDLRWDDEAGTSALVEGEARNLLGTGLALGARYQFGGDFRETRGSVFLPAVLGKGDLTGSVFRTDQDFNADDFTITRLQRGFQVQQQLRLPNRFEVLAGYRFRRNTTLAEGLPPDPIDIAGIDLSLLRNTRDDLLDPRKGQFLSVNLELAPRFVGSDAPFVKGYAQADVARSFAAGSLTWAQSYRVGLSWGFEGQPVIPFERFFAGGAASLRGFATNEVGPRGPLGDPVGGEAVVIVNEELRYRHRSGLGAVVFYDLGNVFATVHDMSFDLRHTLGAGLRWASPVGLLRVDLGFPLGRQEGEKAYRLFFGLGQAF
jgi:outer membrane protein insertion porin family